MNKLSDDKLIKAYNKALGSNLNNDLDFPIKMGKEIKKRGIKYGINQIIKSSYLNLLEKSLLFALESKYPHPLPIEELANSDSEYAKIEEYINQLIRKGLIEKRFQKYRVLK